MKWHGHAELKHATCEVIRQLTSFTFIAKIDDMHVADSVPSFSTMFGDSGKLTSSGKVVSFHGRQTECIGGEIWSVQLSPRSISITSSEMRELTTPNQ